MGSTLDGDLKVTGTVSVGNVANPPKISGGSGAMSTTNKADGSIHLRTDDMPEVKANGQVKKLGLAEHCLECRMDDLSAGAATTYTTYFPKNGKITGVKRRYTNHPASAGGTVVAGVTVGGNQILASAGEDEEGVSDDTLTAHNLTATPANLNASQGDKMVITVTSNNGDMTGGTDPMWYIYYEDRAAA